MKPRKLPMPNLNSPPLEQYNFEASEPQLMNSFLSSSLPESEQDTNSLFFAKKRERQTKTSDVFENDQLPPPAPTKKGRRAIKSDFEVQHDKLNSNSFKYQTTYMAKGTFSSVYSLDRHPTPIINGRNNSELVLKAFHGENTRFNQTALSKYLKTSAQNYRDIVALQLPVAEICNIDTMRNDLFVIQRKIPDEVNCLDQDQLQQITAFFNASVKNNIIMDLQPQNFRVENGQVMLIDFVEEIDEDDDDQANMFNFKACEAWHDVLKDKGLQKDQLRTTLNNLTGHHFNDYIEELLGRDFFVSAIYK